MTTDLVPRAVRQRWSTGSELLRLLHAEPGITRTDAADRLALSSSSITELIERLRSAELLSERRASPTGRGRPTGLLGAHPRGPLVIVVDLAAAQWRVLLGDLVGSISEVGAGSYDALEPADFLPRIANVVARAATRAEGRARAVAAVAGTVSATRLLQFSSRGWHDTDLSVLTGGLPAGSDLPLLVGNDATLGGLTEARTGAARGAPAALHLLVAVGVGGVLLINGQPVTGTSGAGGEYGHLPFGDPALPCPCGAYGCWDVTVDGRALARQLGHDPPGDPISYAHRLLDELADGSPDPRARDAVAHVSYALGSGIAALVNLHDPDLTTIAGLAPRIRAAAPQAFADGYHRGLMAFHRRQPPPVRDSRHDDEAPLHGALTLGVDHLTSPAALARWCRTRPSQPGHGRQVTATRPAPLSRPT